MEMLVHSSIATTWDSELVLYQKTAVYTPGEYFALECITFLIDFVLL